LVLLVQAKRTKPNKNKIALLRFTLPPCRRQGLQARSNYYFSALIKQTKSLMTLEERINTDLKAAMLARDEAALRGIRAIKSAIILAKTEKGSNGTVSPEKEVQLLQKMVKQRRDSIAEFEKANRTDLIQKEQEEVSVIEKYLPAMMGEDEIREVVKQAIATTGATSQKEMGKVMGMVSKQLAGKADNKVVSEIIKSLLTA
jgi:uncharacterized protein YqeY